MWIGIIYGMVIYKFFRRFFADYDYSDVDTSDIDALFSVARRLEKHYGGKAYVGLRIPYADTGSRQDIDIVHVAKGKVMVVSVKNLSGFVSVSRDRSWGLGGGRKQRTETYPDQVAEVKKQASVLESYLQLRGVALPEGSLSYKVVVTYEEWAQLKPGSGSKLSGWVKCVFGTGKENQESLHQKVNFILGTAPMWDRVELKSSKIILGEFLEFKGKEEDILALRNIKRSKVNRISVHKTSMFGLAPSWLQVLYSFWVYWSEGSSASESPSRLRVLYSFRDYRSEGSSASEYRGVTVRSNTEVVFKLQDSAKVRKSKLSSIVSISLSA